MDLGECTAFASAYPICFLATANGQGPSVRPLLLWFADVRGFYFMTTSPKELSEQLHRDPHVEVCFYNGARQMPAAESMRVTGEVEFLDDAELVLRVSEERAALEEIIDRPLRPIAEVFRIASGEVRFWTLRDMLKEREAEPVKF